MPRTTHLFRSYMLPALFCIGLVVLPARADEEAPKPTQDPFKSALEGVIVGTPGFFGKIAVFPLIALKAPKPMAVDTAWSASDLTMHDRTPRKYEYDLVVDNPGERAVLFVGGTVVTGGKIERLVPRDALIAAKSKRIELDALTGSASRDVKAVTKDQRLLPAQIMAPKYLREITLYAPSNRHVRRFLRHFRDLRAHGEAPSLTGTARSEPMMKFCTACMASAANFPRLERPKTIGFITAVGWRLQSMEIFGDNRLARQSFTPMLAAHAYRAAAVALNDEDLSGKPDDATAKKRVAKLTEDAKKLLTRMRDNALVREDDLAGDTAGEAYHLYVRGARGRALALDGRLVHASVFPHDPFEDALYADPLEYDPAAGYGETGTSALERRADRGTLSPFEKRLLERRRARLRGLPVPAGR